MAALTQQQLDQIVAELARRGVFARASAGAGYFTGVRPGTYSNPSSIRVDSKGRIEAIIAGIQAIPLYKSWAFSSLLAVPNPDYFGGFYLFGATDANFTAPVNHGTANVAYGANAFIVTGEVPAADVTLRFAGTGITDSGVRTPGDVYDMVIPAGTPIDTYMETPDKWLGQTTITRVGGPATLCNYGYVKYWDNNNTDFTVTGVEATFAGFANDPDINIELLHHGTNGWTYNAAAPPTPPPAIASLVADYATDDEIVANEWGAWRRDNLNNFIQGSLFEGTLFRVTTSVANSILLGTMIMRVQE